jgi:putative heme-binding domain-containing protein
MRYRGTAFGNAYRGNLFSAHFNPQRIQRHVLKRKGATFVTEDSEFLHSTDPNFHPTDVLEAPDGSLIVIDTGAWYIDQCPLSRISRPEHKGGIYRIRRKGAPKIADPIGAFLNRAKIPPARLAKLLADPRPFVQDKAMDRLAQSPAAVVPNIAALFNDRSISTEAQCRAVWALHRHGSKPARAAIRAALNHPAPEIRIAAARSTGRAADQAAIKPVLTGLRAKHPAVSREMATALGQMGCRSATVALADAAARSADAHHDHAIIRSLIQLNVPEALFDRLQNGSPKARRAALIALDQVDDSPLKMEHAIPHLAAADPALARAAVWVMTHHADWAPGIVGPVRAQFKKTKWTDAETQTMRDALKAFAKNAEVQKLIGAILAGTQTASRRLFLLDVVDKSEVNQLPVAWVTAIGKIITHKTAPEHIRLRAVGVAQSHNLSALDPQLKQVAADEAVPESFRLAILAALAPRLKTVEPEIVRYLIRHATGKSATTRATAARVLGRLPLNEKQILSVADQAMPRADAITLTPLLSVFTRKPTDDSGLALVIALGKMKVETLNATQIGQVISAQPKSAQHIAKTLLAKLAAREKAQAAHLAGLEPLLTGGDVGRGRRVFFGEKAACATCHAIGNEGSRLGPDLTSIGGIRAGRDILEAVVFPSASQVPGYEAFLILTKAGGAHMGVIARETTSAVTLRAAGNIETRLERSKIKSIQPAPVSVMPQGLDKALTRQQLADLLAFLQAQNGEGWLQPVKLGTGDIRVRDSGIRE